MIKRANIKLGEPYDLYAGRANKWLGLDASKWGNPFRLKREKDRPECLENYRQHVLNSPELMACIEELDGLTCGCYCSKKKKCHIDILNEILMEVKLNKL